MILGHVVYYGVELVTYRGGENGAMLAVVHFHCHVDLNITAELRREGNKHRTLPSVQPVHLMYAPNKTQTARQ